MPLDWSGGGNCVSIVIGRPCASVSAVLAERKLELGTGGIVVGLRIVLANVSVMVISSRHQFKSVLRAEQ